jgi:D-apiose dehydrogenase
MNMTAVIIGLGAAARNIHIPACSAVAGLEIVGGLEPQVNNDLYPFPVFTDIDSLFHELSPQAAIIATPTAGHYALCIDMLQRGCHVICEKPFTETLAQAVEVVELAERLNLSVVVNNEFRFMECHLAAKGRIGQPEFGDLRFIEMGQTFYTTEETEQGWRGSDPQRTCKEFGIHTLDLCRYFYDEEPLTLHARMPLSGRKSGPDYLNLIDLEFSGDRYAHITLDRLSRGRHRYLDIRLDGTQACVETSLGGNLSFEVGIKPATKIPYAEFDLSWGGSAYLWQAENGRKLASDPRDLFANATANLLSDWLRSLEESRESDCSGRNNIGTLATMLAAYESARRCEPIDMRKFRNGAGATS